jgi:hypothetical protein
VTTVLDKALKRQVTVGGADYIITIDPDGLRVTGKGKRRPQAELRWSDLLSGDAALAVALNASLLPKPAAKPVPKPAAKPMAKSAARRTLKSGKSD